MDRSFLARAIAAACLTALSFPSRAETRPLNDIVVTGSREGQSRRHTPAAIDVIGPAKIEARRASFIGELLNQAAGVYMPDYRNEQHAMSIRHPLTTSAVYLYMEDGLPLRPPGLFNHNALYELNMEHVARIEVLRGPASSLYGSNAVGGAVNFLTRSALGPARNQLGLQASDQGYRRIDFAVGTGAIGEANAEQGLSLSGYAARKRGGSDRFNDADTYALTLRHDKLVDARTSIKTTLTSKHLDTDMPGGLTPSQFRSDPGFSNHTFTYRQVHATRLTSTLEGHWLPDGLSTVTVFARDNVTDQLPHYRIRNTGATTATGLITNQRFQSIGLEARHRQDWVLAGAQRLRWINGLLLDHSPMEAFEQNLSVSRNARGQYVGYTRGTVARDYSVDVDNQALYTQAEWSPWPRATLVAGLRHDRIRYGHDNHLAPSQTTGAPSEVRTYQHTSPKLGATWRASDTLTWFGNVSEGFTPPEVSAQYGSSLVSPTLKPSTFLNVDAGMRWQDRASGFSGEVALYRLTGKDEILSYNIAPGQSEPRNAGRTRHRGIEFALSQEMGGLSLNLSGSWSRHTYVDYVLGPTQNHNGKDIKAAPRWLANAEVAWQPAPAWLLSAIVQHVDAYWMNDANTRRYGGHQLLHLQAKWRQGSWELWAKLANALDKRHAESASSSDKGPGNGAYVAETMDSYTAGPPRSLLIGLRYHFGTQGSPL